LCYAMHMAAIAVAHIKSRLSGARIRLIAILVCKTWLLFFVPYLSCMGTASMGAMNSLIGFAILIAGTAAFYFLQSRDDQALSSSSRWTRQIIVAGACSSVALLALTLIPLA